MGDKNTTANFLGGNYSCAPLYITVISKSLRHYFLSIMTVFINPDVLPTFSERRSARTGSGPSSAEDSSATEHTTSPESGVKLGKEVEDFLLINFGWGLLITGSYKVG